MLETEIIELKKENERLTEENKALLKIISQMRVTLNRLLNRYITDDIKSAM